MMAGNISVKAYQDEFDNTQRNYTLAKYLNAHLTERDQIYVWGTDPTIYNLTKRLPTGGKYIVSFHVHDLKQYGYTMENLIKNKPKAIVVLTGSGEFPELSGLLEQKYVEVMDFEGNVVYWRMGEN